MSRLHAIACCVLLAACPSTPERTDSLVADEPRDVRETELPVETTATTTPPDSETFEPEPDLEAEAASPPDGTDGGPDIDVTAPCSFDGDPVCDDHNPCTAEACRADGTCAHTPNLALCDDGNPCTSFDRCSGGACVGIGVDCDDDNPCTDDQCTDDVCSHTAADGPCDDGDLCTGGDRCEAGTCTGTPILCPGGGPCGDAVCEPRVGCSLLPRDEGATCDDGNACTNETACHDGACRGVLATCEDGDVCTDDYCDPAAGCLHRDNAARCDDGDPCTGDDRCAAGACAGTALAGCCGAPSETCCATDEDCDDGVACTLDRCEGACHHEPWAALPAEGQVVSDFEGALEGWTFASDNDLVGWRASDTWAASGAQSLYCGDAAGAGYDHGATRATATLAILVPPVEPVLHVVTRRDVSEGGSCVYDALSVLVDGRVAGVVCGSGEGEEAVSLAGFEGAEVQLTFVFDTIDGHDNAGAGVWLDRVRLTGGACDAVGDDP